MQISLRKSQIVSYITYILLFFWFILAGYLYYQHLVSETEQAPTKWGTLVEWVTDTITYIPRIKGFDDRFYKSFLFRRCVTEVTTWWKTTHESDLCTVITNDNKTFLVELKDDAGNRSDGAPVSINDLVFTFEWVMQKNIWDLPQYKGNANVVIQKSSSDTLTVTFPQASKENMSFFTDFILPSHILKWQTRDDYIKTFPTNLVTNGCAQLTNSRDQKSLIFDLTDCKNTRLKYYQVKNYSLEQMQKDPGIMDFYIGNGEIPWYNSGNVITSNYVGAFFNMQLGKLNIYARKNVIALINKYIYLPENSVPIVKEHFLFDGFATAVTDKSTITNIGADYILTGIETLPKELSVDMDINNEKTYTLAWFEEPLTIRIPSAKENNITKIMTHEWVEIPVDSHLISDTSFTLKNEENIFPWFNVFTFYNDQGTAVDSIAVYYKTEKQIAKEKLIHVVYYKWDSIHTHIANTMRNIFIHEWVADAFFFDGKNSLEEYNALLASRKYDINLQTLTLGTRKDISPLLLTDDPLINSSQYINANLASQIRQYFQSNTQAQYNIMPMITKLYTTDLPFFIMGKELKKMYRKPWLGIPENARFDDLTVRKNIVDSVVLVTKPQVTKADILNWRWFFAFLGKSIGFK